MGSMERDRGDGDRRVGDRLVGDRCWGDRRTIGVAVADGGGEHDMERRRLGGSAV